MVEINTPFDLTGKVAVVTGAAGVLGMEHSQALLERGAKVVLTDYCLPSLQQSANFLKDKFDKSTYLHLEMDVSNKLSIENVNRQLKSMELSVNILINNAAIDAKVDESSSISNHSRFENFSIDAWYRELNVGLTGAFLCTQIFGAAMSNHEKGGVILNIASDLSVISPDQRLYRVAGVADKHQSVKPVTYSVIKHGLIGLTKYTATYWADKNIRCNALSPGGVFTGQGKDFVEKISEKIPLNRMARKNEYRSAVQFLCSDASSYMTGQNLVLDGGRSIW
jgi:NAD(P)-dependent dehydrogenase (short-subunit alcohol dehydrogenase family)